jgi:uncharacterized protein YaiE (UPF0345 family)
MVIHPCHKSRRRAHAAALIAELIVALAIAAGVLVPLAFTFSQEHKALLGQYHRAVAMEIVDGEIEVLAAGEWRAFKPGSQPYEVKAAAARNLPKGTFTLTLADKQVRLEWKSDKGARVAREVRLP